MIDKNSKYKKQFNKSKIKVSEFADTRETVLHNLNTTPEWVGSLDQNPIPYIIRKGKPGDVFLLLKNVYGLDHNHALYRLVELAVFKQQALHKISNKNYQSSNNIDNEVLFYYQLQKIHQLVDLGATDYLNVIKDQIIKLMDFQDENGRFPMNYHHHARACNLLMDLGLEGNKLIDKAIHFIISRQRDDGGWLHRNNLPKGLKYEDAPSCIWTTAEISLLLTKRKIFKNYDYLSKSASFLLGNYLNKNRSTLLPKSDAWECLSINHTSEHMFAGGTLKILEILLSAKVEDNKKIKKMISWLTDQQLEDSLFPKIANKHPISDIAVTNRVLYVMKKYFETI